MWDDQVTRSLGQRVVHVIHHELSTSVTMCKPSARPALPSKPAPERITLAAVHNAVFCAPRLANAYPSIGIPIRRSLESHGDVAGVPATLRRGHVHDKAPVEGLERQKRSDERTVVASHVKDVAPENGSTTSRHAERNDVVDALRALQSIGVMRMIVSESNVVVMTGDHPACRRIQIGADP